MRNCASSHREETAEVGFDSRIYFTLTFMLFELWEITAAYWSGTVNNKADIGSCWKTVYIINILHTITWVYFPPCSHNSAVTWTVCSTGRWVNLNRPHLFRCLLFFPLKILSVALSAWHTCMLEMLTVKMICPSRATLAPLRATHTNPWS